MHTHNSWSYIYDIRSITSNQYFCLLFTWLVLSVSQFLNHVNVNFEKNSVSLMGLIDEVIVDNETGGRVHNSSSPTGSL